VDEFFEFEDLLLVLEHAPRINRQLTANIILLDFIIVFVFLR
jgi:hypothetical protein